MNLCPAVDPRPFQKDGDQTARQQRSQRIFQIPVAVLLKIPEDPCVQLLLVQGRLQVDLNAAFFVFFPMGTG